MDRQLQYVKPPKDSKVAKWHANRKQQVSTPEEKLVAET
jgi:hypothetical protein